MKNDQKDILTKVESTYGEKLVESSLQNARDSIVMQVMLELQNQEKSA